MWTAEGSWLSSCGGAFETGIPPLPPQRPKDTDLKDLGLDLFGLRFDLLQPRKRGGGGRKEYLSG